MAVIFKYFLVDKVERNRLLTGREFQDIFYFAKALNQTTLIIDITICIKEISQ